MYGALLAGTVRSPVLWSTSTGVVTLGSSARTVPITSKKTRSDAIGVVRYPTTSPRHAE